MWKFWGLEYQRRVGRHNITHSEFLLIMTVFFLLMTSSPLFDDYLNSWWSIGQRLLKIPSSRTKSVCVSQLGRSCGVCGAE